jgi:short-subunit dehydrogenase
LAAVDARDEGVTIKLKSLGDQVIVITGASSGIGRVTAREAAARGARVMLVARNEAALAEAVAEIEAAGGTAAYMVADVGKAEEVDAAAEAAVSRFGRIDSWVNNAGVAIYAKLVDTPAKEHKQLFRTNYFGMVNGCLAAIRHLRGEGGALITVASVAADIPSPIMGAYAASKHAVRGYFESLRIEVKADALPISLTLIKPAGIATPIAEHAANHGDGEAVIPPPTYAPELVADAILHACEHPRRDITVGGVGKAQVLVAQHFPPLLDKLGPLMMRGLFNPRRQKTEADNLHRSSEAGRDRGYEPAVRESSLYTAAALHPVVFGSAVAVGAALVSLLVSRSRRARGD